MPGFSYGAVLNRGLYIRIRTIRRKQGVGIMCPVHPGWRVICV